VHLNYTYDNSYVIGFKSSYSDEGIKMENFPALNAECVDHQIADRLQMQEPPRILILYGSVRERSYSRFAAEEAGRLLTAMGADVKMFNPSGLPLPDDAPETHPKVTELRELVRWSDGMV
jgi:arsenic resistance protein ArsH